MPVSQTHAVPEEATNGTIPPLVDGDRMTRAEFERRYHAMPPHVKAELIEGVVSMPLPVRSEEHAEPHAGLIGWLVYYRAFSPGTAVNADGTVRLGSSSEPQPDAAMFIRPECGGRVRISADDYVEGGPELVAEVAASSIPLDTGPKFQMYLLNDVQEYIIWRVRIRRSIGSCARRAVCAAGTGRRRRVPQRGLSRPMAGRSGPVARRPGHGPVRTPTRRGRRRTRRVRFPAESAPAP